MPFLTSVIRRFESQFTKTAGCWVWKACKRYGTFSYRGKDVAAHRFAYRIYVGQIPNKLQVCHSCDNPKCVNPNHLFLGTQKDNLDDMLSESRDNRTGPITSAKGERHGRHKLTKSQVLEIRRRHLRTGYYKSNSQSLAEEFGVDYTMINKIVSRKYWTHI